MQIDFLLYEKALKSMYGTKSIEQIKKFLMTHLVCHKCGEVKSDIEFSRSKQSVNRRERFPVCKDCCKDGYTKRKEKDESASRTV